MSIIKVKTKGQLTLPSQIRDRVGVRTGDFLEVKVEAGNKIILTPKTLVDKHIAASLAEFEVGAARGPFKSADELIKDLQKKTKSKHK